MASLTFDSYKVSKKKKKKGRLKLTCWSLDINSHIQAILFFWVCLYLLKIEVKILSQNLQPTKTYTELYHSISTKLPPIAFLKCLCIMIFACKCYSHEMNFVTCVNIASMQFDIKPLRHIWFWLNYRQVHSLGNLSQITILWLQNLRTGRTLHECSNKHSTIISVNVFLQKIAYIIYPEIVFLCFAGFRRDMYLHVDNTRIMP